MILPTAYFAPIFQFALVAQNKQYELETCEHFVKQSYRTRCEIYGANGLLKLLLPLKKWKNHSLSKEVEVAYDDNWQMLHWRSIESAYRTSPFFEFYEEEIKPLFFLSEKRLVDYNQILERELKKILKIESESSFTEKYEAAEPDWRTIIHPKNKALIEKAAMPKYIQVFESKFGFLPNLSILDLLFNLGPQSKAYLENLSLDPWQKK